MCALDQTGHPANREPPQLAERLAMTGVREVTGSANLVMDLPAVHACIVVRQQCCKHVQACFAQGNGQNGSLLG